MLSFNYLQGHKKIQGMKASLEGYDIIRRPVEGGSRQQLVGRKESVFSLQANRSVRLQRWGYVMLDGIYRTLPTVVVSYPLCIGHGSRTKTRGRRRSSGTTILLVKGSGISLLG